MPTRPVLLQARKCHHVHLRWQASYHSKIHQNGTFCRASALQVHVSKVFHMRRKVALATTFLLGCLLALAAKAAITSLDSYLYNPGDLSPSEWVGQHATCT
jgi:hypothetical protein